MRRFLCGVEAQYCSGGNSMCSSGLGNGVRTHSSPQEAFGCKRKSLIAQNWEQIGAKEFRPPAGVNDGFILVLTRPGKYGAEMRGGKSGEKGTGKGRVMPKSGKSGYIA